MSAVTPIAERLRRMLTLLVLLSHAVAAAGWWWMMPGGFPLFHRRFLSNQAVPLLMIIAAFYGVYALLRRRMEATAAIVCGLSAMWMSAGLVGGVMYPQSSRLPFAAAVGAGIVIALSSPGTAWSRRAGTVVAAGLLLGVSLVWSQRSPRPTTTPNNLAARWPGPAHLQKPPIPNVIPLNGSLRVQPASGAVTFQHGGYVVIVEPMLAFVSRSPDRFWTVFAPETARVSPLRELAGISSDADRFTGFYGGAEPSMLVVTNDAQLPRVEIEASTSLFSPVYSHLNTFCYIEVGGHRQLSLSFSPCADVKVPVKPFGYPAGDPIRLAYMDDGGGFHVVEARRGEKGPFRTLASGTLRREQPLEIVMWDGDVRFAGVTLHDWAAQASTDLSPTAGWGLPQNAIEFLSVSGGPATASIYVTLAGTSVGRGWDSVGHAVGTYRNRMSVTVEKD